MGGRVLFTIVVLAAAFLLAGALVTGLAGKADARASIQEYLKGPNDFYPSGHDREGPVKLVIDTVGWNATRLAGNLGIGNGSVSTFDQTSTHDVEYPAAGFMCADVSQQPWVPGSKTEAPQVEEAAEENATGEVTGDHTLPGESVMGPASPGNVSSNALEIVGGNATGGAENTTGSSAGENASNESGRFATNNAAPANTELASAAGENLTYAAYHPIQYLRPVKDLLYEHPLATSGTAYCELLGFETPAGLVNVGMKTTGYGY